MIRLPKYPKFANGDQARRIAEISARANLDLASFSARSCVITGSNGKGGTAAMTASILREAGRNVGLFTSPHLFEINERFARDGAPISDADLDHHWRRTESAIDAWLADNPGEAVGGFEFLFLVAASAFEACDACVWEAGIGGRRDVTRFVRTPLAAIVSLDLEHTSLLGDTLEAIALDKADVIAPNGRLLLGQSAAPHAAAIQAHRPDLTLEIVAPRDWPSPLTGPHQANNAALAARLASLMSDANEASIAKGVARVRWPGRLEAISRDPAIVIDVGHTPAAIAGALQGFLAMHGATPNVLVVGASADKDASGALAILAPAFPRIVATRARHKGRDPAAIAALAAAANPRAEVAIAPDVAAARAAALARAEAGAIYVAGGLFLAAEMKALVEGRDPGALAFF
ncbi:MAG: hypothetical protein JNJ73_04120 [Hyphomonadaceae bacterium]|nr:hypothetical protein [Hyphomonadaceae bacterium]